MKILRRLIPAAVVVGAAILLLYLPDIGPERYTDLATYFKVERGRQAYAGYTISAVASGSVLYVEAFGTDGTGGVLDEDTPLLVGPASKTFTAVAALSMARDGLLNLDKPLTSYLPWFSFAGGGGDTVTLRHLLSDTSGVEDSSFDDVHDSARNLESAVRSLAAARPSSPPGKSFHYINTGWQAIGLVMEKVAAKPFADIMDQRIFRPLGMKGSTANRDRMDRSVVPGNASFFGAPLQRIQPLTPFAPPSSAIATTANDLGIWLSFLMAPEKQAKPPLSPSATRRIFEPAFPDIPFGLGWFLSGKGESLAAWHDGALDGFSSRLEVWPGHKAGIAIVATQGSLIQSMISMPALADGARLIMTEGKAPRPIPVSRLYILLAVAAAVHLLGLVVQTGAAPHWAKEVRGRAEAKGSPGPLRIAKIREWLGIPARLAVVALAPAALSLVFGRHIEWKSAFALEPGLAAWFLSACFFGFLRNVARIAWLGGAPLPPRGKRG